MSKHCLNCGHPINLNYCPQCAQATNVGRVTWKSFNEEFLHTFTHFEKTIFATIRQLIKNPAKLYGEYFAGKRKKYQSPVSFFIIWVTISIFTHQAIIAHSGFHPVYLKGLTFSRPESIQVFIKHGEWLYILCFPISAAIFFLILGRRTYSYIECIIITMYSFSLVYVLHTLYYLIGGALFSLNVLHWRFYLFQIVTALIYTIWVCYNLLRKKNKPWLWVRIAVYLTVNAVVVLRFLEFMSNLWFNAEAEFHVH